MKISPLQPNEIQLFRSRVTVIGVIITLLFSLLGSRLWYLQILNGKDYEEISQGNRIRLVPQAAPRGVIYDRNGVALADNRPAYQLQLIREDTRNLEQTLQNLSNALQIPYASLRKKVHDNRSQAPFKPIILDEDLGYRKAVIVETYQEDFPGISIVIQSRRFYPHNKIASHLLGYVGVRSEEQENALPKNQDRSGLIIGQAGMELLNNEILIGKDGGKQIEVDNVGRELRILNKPVNPISGDDLYLTIDTRLQKFVHTTMQGQSGAVVVMRPKTGEILAMASFPNFNPNLFAAGISRKNWNRLTNNPDHPLENKAIQGAYPPGSPFKLVTGYAGLDMGVINEYTTYVCNGFYYLKGRRTPYKCWSWERGGHGIVDIRKAVQMSCNVFFYQVAQEIGVDRLHDYAKKFGFGLATRINLPNEKQGLVPSEAWKLNTFGERWYRGETPPVSIGQGYLSATPMQLINFINIIANNGMGVQPQLVMNRESLPVPKPLGFNKEYLQLLREGMVLAVNERGGTARVSQSEKMLIAAKTGTAQVVSHKTTKNWDKQKKSLRAFQNHAWFVAFGPAENPEISVAVLVEHGGGGAKAAGPVAKKIFDYYIENFYEPEAATEEDRPQSAFTQQLQQAFLPN